MPIAGGVLDGSTTLRQVGTSTAYREQLDTSGAALLAHRTEIGEAAFAAKGQKAERLTEQLRSHL